MFKNKNSDQPLTTDSGKTKSGSKTSNQETKPDKEQLAKEKLAREKAAQELADRMEQIQLRMPIVKSSKKKVIKINLNRLISRTIIYIVILFYFCPHF